MNIEKYIKLKETITSRMNEEITKSNFELNTKELKRIHKDLFKNVYFSNGEFRKFNVTRDEELLYGDTIDYPDFHTIPTYLDYVFKDEKKVDYNDLTPEEVAKYIALFTSQIWFVHPFGDGNTRTTAIFIEKYLRSLGYDVNNDIFKENATYFRNALVKANFKSYEYSIKADIKPLVKFYQKVLIDNSIELDFNDLYIEDLYVRKTASKVKKKLIRR